MNSDTLLYRMISPSWMQDGSPTTPAFKPTRKDNGRLSVYDGDQISPTRRIRTLRQPRQQSRGSIGGYGRRM